jgi:predicted protein tyrosine phosphatase
MKPILFVCSPNLQRSPTAELVYKEILKEKNIQDVEVKSAGLLKSAVNVLTNELIKWADKIYVMEEYMKEEIVKKVPEANDKIRVLNIEDVYFINDPVLRDILRSKLEKEI